MRQLRQYEPIWNRLKEKRTARVTAPPEYHPRIVKAVIKEKHTDLVYKLHLAEKNKKARLSYIVKGSIIEFTLTTNITLEDL